MSEKTFYLTTPIYYINSTPHMGHAYTTIAADARARFERMRGRRVYFLTGTDEHGTKVARAARDQNITPQEYADQIAGAFRECWDTLAISYDDFIRTTEARHETVARHTFEELWKRGHLRTGSYSGWYSVPDETFFREEDTVERALSDGTTGHFIAQPSEDQSKAPLEWVEEATHFFTLSTQQQDLIDFYAAHPDVLEPDSRRNETLAFINSGLRDASVSRELEWGITLPPGVPESENHCIYVWFEALMNYLSAPGYQSENAQRRAHFEECWPPDLQLMSKDIFTRFHATLWMAMLRALDLPTPRLLFAHGFWTVDGRKMSKRDPETIVEPVAFAREMASRSGASIETTVDALRYYCLREVTFGSDGDFSKEGCVGRYNSDLANGLGNLVNRALSMLAQYFESVVPPGDERLEAEIGLRNAARAATGRVEAAYETLDFSHALTIIWEIVGQGNRVIEEQKPWAKIKAGDRASVAALLRELLSTCAWCAQAIAPVMPHTAHRLLDLLQVPPTSWNAAADSVFAAGHRCQAPRPLFPRIEIEKVGKNETRTNRKADVTALGTAALRQQLKDNTMSNEETHKPNSDAEQARAHEMIVEANVSNMRTADGAAPADSSPFAHALQSHGAGEATAMPSSSAAAAPPIAATASTMVDTPGAPGMSTHEVIEYADFARVELRAGRVLEAERIPKADKLLKLQVDLGTEKRQILAGIAQQFEPESLIGKTVVVVVNLAPRTMRGLESQGMLLAASATSDGPPSGLLTVDADVPPGSIIR